MLFFIFQIRSCSCISCQCLAPCLLNSLQSLSPYLLHFLYFLQPIKIFLSMASNLSRTPCFHIPRNFFVIKSASIIIYVSRIYVYILQKFHVHRHSIFQIFFRQTCGFAGFMIIFLIKACAVFV